MDEDVFFDEFGQLRAALDLLAERDRVVLQRAYFGGLSQQEIALELNTSALQISRLQRDALSKLRGILDEMQRGES